MSRRAVRPVAQPSGQPATREYWARDPFGRHELRWWNGNTYTDMVMDDGVESSDTPGPRATTQPSAEPAIG